MGKRTKLNKKLNLLKNSMEELSLGNNNNSKKINTEKMSSFETSSKPEHFILSPSHPFYWHLSNRENCLKNVEELSTNEYPDDKCQSENKLIVKKIKSLKKRPKVRRNKKNKTKTFDLNICHYPNNDKFMNLDKINRRGTKRAAKKLKSHKMKRRFVNKTLANELNQLSIL